MTEATPRKKYDGNHPDHDVGTGDNSVQKLSTDQRENLLMAVPRETVGLNVFNGLP
jgi:hypothetical protein